ncbi:MAG: penicillin acylase family protein, partial [Cellvibrionaceae bacterium]|nr:penicillin acylase family protein [Cellvibrionaceae bacterium]
PEQYWHDGQYKNFKSWSETIKVKGAEPLTITARRAAQGMVLMHQPEQGLAVARARAWEGKELASLMAWVELSKRKTIAEAKAEVGKVATNINFYYMDKTGNIAYTHAGRYPVRAAGHDPRIPAPGGGRWDWRGLRSYQENPTVENPEQGYIANWNNRPARGWAASDLWPLSWGRADRNQLLDDQLAGDKKMTAAEVWQVNRAVSFADVNLPFLL